MSLALEIFLMILFVGGLTYLCFYSVRRCYRIKDYDIHIQKLLIWINETEILFFNENKENKVHDIKELGQ
jgi:hypothetical protein